MKVNSNSTLALGLALVLGIYARDAEVDVQIGQQEQNINTRLEGEFAREFAREFAGNLLGRRALENLQIFTGALGGVTADTITNSGDHSRPFMVAGDTFPAYTDAVSRSCANQNNKCADAANNPSQAVDGLSVKACQTQSSSCVAAGATATQTNFQVLTSSNAEFDFICDS